MIDREGKKSAPPLIAHLFTTSYSSCDSTMTL
jgi:hypothetical protein